MPETIQPVKKHKSDSDTILFIVDGEVSHEGSAPDVKNIPKPDIPVTLEKHHNEPQPANPQGTLASIPCKFFLSGSCKSGSLCPFSHRADGVRNAPRGNIVVCQYFERGACKEGEKCRFLHPQQSLSPTTGTPCRFYGSIRGCKLGKECPFVHLPQQKTEIPKLADSVGNAHGLLDKYSSVKIAESKGVEAHSRRAEN